MFKGVVVWEGDVSLGWVDLLERKRRKIGGYGWWVWLVLLRLVEGRRMILLRWVER